MTKGWLNDDFDVPGDLSVTGDITNSPIRLISGYVENLGVTYSAGTFTIQGANATLSASNPGYVCLPSSSAPGTLILYTLTADQNFIDDAGSSEIIGNLFGFPTGVAVAARRFYGYAVSNDAETAISFMLSRMSHHTSSPAAAAIGDPGDPVADDIGDFWSFDTITEADYESNPCACVFSIRMAMSTSDDWTVSAIDATDGFGRNNDRNNFIPRIRSRVSSTISNITGDGTVYSIIPTVEDIDTSLMTISTGIFVCPREGYYQADVTMFVSGIGASHTDGRLYIYPSNRNYENRIGDPSVMNTGAALSFQNKRLIDLSVGDTVNFRLYVAGSTLTVDITGNATNGLSQMSLVWVGEL